MKEPIGVKQRVGGLVALVCFVSVVAKPYQSADVEVDREIVS